MIAKQVQGSDFRKVLDYVHNKSGAQLIGSNMMGKEPESLASEFQMSSDLRKRVTKCVYHVSLSLSPSEKLSDRQWVEVARAYLKGMEFDGNQYAIYRHTDREHDHIHVIASRIRVTDGSVVSDSWQYKRSEKLVRQLEQQFGLLPTRGSRGKRERSPTTGEIRQQRRTGTINKRSQLQAIVKQSLSNSPSLEEFIYRLSAKEVSVRLRKSSKGKIEGISFGLDGVAFQGRQLGKDYSWNSLEATFDTETSHQPVSLMPDENPEAQSDSLEQQKKRLREKYVNFAARVRNLPQFPNRKARDIDIGVTLLSLKAGDNLEEAKRILTHSDTVRQWHQELPRETFLNVAKQYIWQVASQAIELIQKRHLKEKAVELE